MDGSNKIESGTVFSAMNVNRVRIKEQRDKSEKEIYLNVSKASPLKCYSIQGIYFVSKTALIGFSEKTVSFYANKIGQKLLRINFSTTPSISKFGF